ncbi:hypothetical protein K493DRAFT_319557 [Basidiobolus meristosporus CBS 931.73]|uniref:Uncharacterized protein n=1 Tax=Basidiobolus meristosporus CBS 931.73 TaxID=1314790 RepID=A0A1Y1XRQ5_9FUNG|nr:hypothetical protein K493DRAFT_319557 [Basidiobolus meristosporus CBS 931.73]|eukprot:ORX88176.1 hypothetical protein K493DRAFT_319557 [Basidiobolus meristosporus CBS 931.73]
MDSDWCIVCDKHLNSMGGLYCSEACRHKEQLKDSANSVNFGTPSYSHVKQPANDLLPFTIKFHKRTTCYRPIFPKCYPPTRTLSHRASRRFHSTVLKEKPFVKY